MNKSEASFPSQADKPRPKRKLSWRKIIRLVAFAAVIVAAVVTIARLCKEHRKSKSLSGVTLIRFSSPNGVDSIQTNCRRVDSLFLRKRNALTLVDNEGLPVKHKVKSVSSFARSFPDNQPVQIRTALRLGIHPVSNRDEAENHRENLVYVGNSPYYDVRPLTHSIPYLTRRAEALLSEIARNYLDSLAVKNIPLHKIMVTSVLRTQSDLKGLMSGNSNAVSNSCHLYGTTFDIVYNDFTPVDPDKTYNPVLLKSVLAEVLNDLRLRGTCYVKYERKQACFHITAR